MENRVLESTKFVVDNSSFVKINHNAIKRFCTDFDHEHIKHWLDEAPFDINTLGVEDRLNFMLVFNAISFSYWGDPKWTIEYNGMEYDGSWAMIACIARSMQKSEPILNAEYLSKLTKDDFASVLKGNVVIPLFYERLKILNSIGDVLKKKFDGRFSNLINLADQDAVRLVGIIIENFPEFKDDTRYKSKQIFFFKRAQLLVADIYQAFQGVSIGKMNNITKITACADYKLPKILRKMGILEYEKSLAEKIDNFKELPGGSEEEIEIRANTIWATEYIQQELKSTIPEITSIHVNDHLWLISQSKLVTDRPYHRTRTTDY